MPSRIKDQSFYQKCEDCGRISVLPAEVIESSKISLHPSLAVWGQDFWACKGRGIFRTLLNYCNGAPLEAWSRCYAAWQDVSGAEPLRGWHRRVYH